jgi:hypothetical protein
LFLAAQIQTSNKETDIKKFDLHVNFLQEIVKLNELKNLLYVQSDKHSRLSGGLHGVPNYCMV